MAGLARPPNLWGNKLISKQELFVPTLLSCSHDVFIMGWPPSLILVSFQMPDRLHLFLLCRNQFTSGDCVSSESGSRPRWDRPHEHRWTAARPGVPTTGPGYHTGDAAELRSTFIPEQTSFGRWSEEPVRSFGSTSTACWNVWDGDCLLISLRLKA